VHHGDVHLPDATDAMFRADFPRVNTDAPESFTFRKQFGKHREITSGEPGADLKSNDDFVSPMGGNTHRGERSPT